MGTWNYRILRSDIDESVGVYTLYYDDAGNVRARSTEPSGVGGYDVGDLAGTLARLTSALALPPLRLTAVDAAIAGTGPAINPGPRSTPRALLEWYERAAKQLHDQLAVAALPETVRELS